MENIKVVTKGVCGTVSRDAIEALAPEGNAALETLLSGSGAGNDFLEIGRAHV